MQQQDNQRNCLLYKKAQVYSNKESQKLKLIQANHRLLHGNIFEILFFKWVSPLLEYGDKYPVSEDVMPVLDQEQNTKHDFSRLDQKFKNSDRVFIRGLTLIKALAATFWKTLLKIAIQLLLVIGLKMYSLILINKIMDYIKKDSQKRSLTEGIILFFVVLLVLLIKCITENQLNFNSGIIGFNCSNTVNLMIYKKTLKYPALCQKKHTIAEIINYTEVDAQRLTGIGFQLSKVFQAPIQLFVGIYLMVSFLGLSFIAGIAVIIISTILTYFISNYSSNANAKLLQAKDARLKQTEQTFNIIRFIKCNAMEKYFFNRIDKKRTTELQLNKSVQVMYIFLYLIYFLTTPLAMALTFYIYIWMGNKMTSNIAFTSILLFKIIQFPLILFPQAIGELIQIWSSMKRVQDFLWADQLNLDCFLQSYNRSKDKNAIKITNGTFEWGLQLKKEEQENQGNQAIQDVQVIQQIQGNQRNQGNQQKPKTIIALNDVNLEFKKYKLTMILGDIGSGKSSLLYAILNEMQPVNKSETRIQVNGTLAFVSQKAWIMSSTVKENITFTLPYNRQIFQRVVHYASLEKDIAEMNDGIDTQLGEKGINLSGGQIARVNLARALYSDRDIYLLDDIISAVDVHVGRFLMKQTIVQFLRGKTVILATHAISFAQYADQIIIMKKGKVTQKGTYRQVAETEQYKYLTQIQNKRKNSVATEKHYEIDQEQIDKSQDKYQNKENKLKSLQKIKSEEKIESEKQQHANQTQTQKLVYQLMLPEEQNEGKLQWKVYASYAKLNGGVFFVIGLLFCLIVWLILYSLSSIQVERWSEHPRTSWNHFYLFIGLLISSSFVAFFRILILVLAGFKQSTNIHKNMIKALLYASIPDFFHRVPIGRIINRLAKDLRVIDQILSYAVQQFIAATFSLLASFVICVYASSPYILILIVPMVASSIYIKNYYMKTQVQIVRLEAISNSPIVSGLMQTLNGLSVIRSYNLQEKFIEEQIKRVNRNKQIKIVKKSLQGWFSLRITLLSFIINIAAIAFCLLSFNQNASLTGLLMTYTLTINDTLIEVMIFLADMENQMVSYERIINFIEIEPEPGYAEYCKEWAPTEQTETQSIQRGNIRFEKFGIRYRQNLPFILRNVSLSIKEGEKVGIVGRTGAGKSTIVSCLLRILEPTEGRILIDEKNIMDYKLRDLRTHITIIDQQPNLISGTFKENLDPSNNYSSEELNDIIKQCNLQEIINERGGIQTQINNDSISAGEKQLLCICRAFLKKSKIVLIDEATANIDMKNDALIQQVIHKKFAQSTVLTIAHRLQTLKNVDKIIVLGQGKVLEWGSPRDLLNKQQGIYRSMVNSHNKDFLK